MNRFLIRTKLEMGQIIHLDKTQKHHMLRVLRKKEGDRVEIINAMGTFAKCYLLSNGSLKIVKIEERQADTHKKTLAIGLCHPSKLELVTEKATELGVNELCIFKGQKSSTKELNPSKYKRLETIRDSALKQSKRFWDMTIKVVSSLQEIDFSQKNVCYADVNCQTTYTPQNDTESLIIVGPESGFSEQELVFCKENDFFAISLSKNVLRAETAAIVSAFLLVR